MLAKSLLKHLCKLTTSALSQQTYILLGIFYLSILFTQLSAQTTVQAELYISTEAHLYVDDDISIQTTEGKLINHGHIEMTMDLKKDSLSSFNSSFDSIDPSCIIFRPITPYNPKIQGSFYGSDSFDSLVVDLPAIDNQLRLDQSIEVRQVLNLLKGGVLTDTLSHQKGSNYRNHLFISSTTMEGIAGIYDHDLPFNYIEGKLRRSIDSSTMHTFPIGLRKEITNPKRTINIKSSSIDTVLVFFDPIESSILDEYIICDIGSEPNVFDPDGLLDSLILVNEIGKWQLTSNQKSSKDVQLGIFDFYNIDDDLPALRINSILTCPREASQGLSLSEVMIDSLSIVAYERPLLSHIETPSANALSKHFPNPLISGQELNIRSDKNLKSIFIYTDQGQIVESFKDLETKNIKLSLMNLKSGIYILNIVDQQDYSNFQKLIIHE